MSDGENVIWYNNEGRVDSNKQANDKNHSTQKHQPLSKAEEQALKEYPVINTPLTITSQNNNEMKLDLNKNERDAYIKGYNQAEKDTIKKTRQWLAEMHRVCDITDEHGYNIELRKLRGEYEKYINQ